jgi:adenylate cyclase
MVEESGNDALTSFLESLGATGDQIETARRECSLARLPADLILTRDATLSAKDIAGRAQVDVDEVVGLWRTLGVNVPDDQRCMFTEQDASFTAIALQFEPVGAHAGELFRVLGNSLSRVAEAAVSLYVQTIEPTMDTPDPDFLRWVMSVAETTSLALRLGDSMGAIFAHHLSDAIERQRAAQSDFVDRALFRLAVGFVDLVGFTPLSQHADPADLLALVGEFEARAFDVAVAHGGRIVKHIGDEVMFVALDADAGCAIAHELTSVCAEGIEPRGGVAFGDVVTRHGDYYGSVVNLASRLAELAIPREVLVDARTVAEGKGGPFEFQPAGHRLLKGFEEPVEVFSIIARSE